MATALAWPILPALDTGSQQSVAITAFAIPGPDRQQKSLKAGEDHARNVAERMMPRDVARGLNSVRRFVQQHGVQ